MAPGRLEVGWTLMLTCYAAVYRYMSAEKTRVAFARFEARGIFETQK